MAILSSREFGGLMRGRGPYVSVSRFSCTTFRVVNFRGLMLEILRRLGMISKRLPYFYCHMTLHGINGSEVCMKNYLMKWTLLNNLSQSDAYFGPIDAYSHKLSLTLMHINILFFSCDETHPNLQVHQVENT